jgi:hypothetical protein
LRRAILAGLVVLAGVWLVGVSFRGQRVPAHTATATAPALGLTVTAELFALSSDLTEFERRFTLASAAGGGPALRVRMSDVRGPASRTGLYRVGETEVALLGLINNDGRYFAVGPLRRLDNPSRPPPDWTCLGVFELAMVPYAGDPARGRSQVFAFVPAEERNCPAPTGQSPPPSR